MRIDINLIGSNLRLEIFLIEGFAQEQQYAEIRARRTGYLSFVLYLGSQRREAKSGGIVTL
jgi:hypothetical protein